MAKTVTFESKAAHFKLIRQHKHQQPLPTGGWHTTQNEIGYQFQPVPSKLGENTKLIGVLTVKEGQDKLSTDSESWLRSGEEVGVERDAVAALMANRGYGSKFWLQGWPPGTLSPRPQDFRKDVRLALATLDEEGLIEMIQKERSTHERTDLLSEAEDALTLVRETLAQAAAEAEKQAASKPAPKQKASA